MYECFVVFCILFYIFQSDDSESEEVEEEKPVLAGKKRKRTSPESKKSSKPHVSQVKSKLLSFQASSAPPVESESLYLHETLDFLHPQKIRDANGNRPGNPDYDNTTLKVPAEFFKKLTPAMYQWWTIKSNHFDVILFFKVQKMVEVLLKFMLEDCAFANTCTKCKTIRAN